MSDTYELENNAIYGEDETGSLKHSIVQTNLAGLLKFKSNNSMFKFFDLDIKGYWSPDKPIR